MMMKNSTKERVVDYLSKIENELYIPLKNEEKRFLNADNLLNRFRDIQNIEEKLKSGNKSFLNQIIEITNELCLAKLILDDLKNKCRELIYEPSPKPGKLLKTIDFCASMENGHIIYCDVKTIQPDTIDAWGKFETAIGKKLFPENVNVILDKEYLGGEIWHNSYSSRGRMLEYTIELESKIKNYEITDKVYFIMVFCSDGFDWGLDEVGDFADFYKTGSHNLDDPFQKMENYDMEKEQIKLQRSINEFCYLERSKTETKISKFICPVRKNGENYEKFLGQKNFWDTIPN